MYRDDPDAAQALADTLRRELDEANAKLADAEAENHILEEKLAARPEAARPEATAPPETASRSAVVAGNIAAPIPKLRATKLERVDEPKGDPAWRFLAWVVLIIALLVLRAYL